MPNFPAKSAPGAERIRAAFKDAQSMAQTAVAKALYCGQLLIEQRDSLSGSHLVKDRTKPSDQKFDVWLAKSVPEISRPTAYRWMRPRPANSSPSPPPRATRKPPPNPPKWIPQNDPF